MTVKKQISRSRFWLAVYFGLLVILFLTVSLVPILVQQGITLPTGFAVEEEVLESGLILFLFAVSFFIYKGYRRRMAEYQAAVARSGERQAALTSQLTEAFRYIGEVNVEIDRIMNDLCGIYSYPFSRKELKQLFHQIADQAMSLVHAPWVVIRMIHRNSGRTIKEYAFEHDPGALPATTVGNRAILEKRTVEDRQVITTCQHNLVLQTVFILPKIDYAEEALLLMSAMVNQVEMLFLLYHPDLFQHNPVTALYPEVECTHRGFK